jgi:hypothetical protein
MKKISLLDATMILVIIFVIAALVYGFFGLTEVETYTFHATITNMEVVKRADGRSSFSHYIYWVDGMLSGADKVSGNVYARYREGDLIEITGVIEEDWFGNVFETFEIRG